MIMVKDTKTVNIALSKYESLQCYLIYQILFAYSWTEHPFCLKADNALTSHSPSPPHTFNDSQLRLLAQGCIL